MPKETAAEWILTLVTTPGRATSTVGDLLEEGSGRGAYWFWSSVLRTAASHVWRDLCSARGRMIWLVLSGMQEGLVLTLCFVYGLMNPVIRVWTDIWPYQIGPNSFYIPPWGFYGLIFAVETAVPLLVGWDVARRSKGRELAAGVALASAFSALAFLSGTPVVRFEHPYRYVQNALPGFCATGLFVMAGALLSRLQARRRSQADRRFHPA